ncbi:porin family protein [Agriterribacter sp.]|uniref:porin family protein n=1 Tax=Agriterribacter sp. TaxID=2821509 RepID=UPI002C7A2F98|nr:porin family protein [Agriterribacter sp.]HRO48317.1 porin family protein [Agriterribacter sp.]HRQ15970.1 porin family protein [Agriterribacter sp.]
MKKQFIVLTTALVLGITAVYAQKGEDKLVSFGIRAGVNLQKIYGDDFMGNKLNNDFTTGFHAGINADLFISEGFYLQPGLLYSTKGAERKNNNIEYTEHISYVELPVNLVFKPELGGGRLLLGAGPYAAYGISGKNKTKANGTAVELDAKFKGKISAAEYATTLLNAAYYVKPFDFGGNILVGYELNSGFSLQLNGQLGLSQINPEVDGVAADKSKWKNIGFGASLGYRF